MFHANIKVMFKVNGYEFKVRNTSETTKQVSLHDKDGSLLCSYPLHDYYHDKFDYSGLNSCLIEFNKVCNKLNTLTIARNKVELVIKIQRHYVESKGVHEYRLDINDINNPKFDKVHYKEDYSDNYLTIVDRLLSLPQSYLGLDKQYIERLLPRLNIVEYKGEDSNW